MEYNKKGKAIKPLTEGSTRGNIKNFPNSANEVDKALILPPPPPTSNKAQN